MAGARGKEVMRVGGTHHHIGRALAYPGRPIAAGAPAPRLAGPVSQTESGEGGIGKKKTRHVGRVFNGRSPILTLVRAVYSQ